MKIRKISSMTATKIKKVAAYARVSTTQGSQEESFESQVAYFTEFIQSVPDWEMIRVYADEGISGLNAEKRPGFKQMVEDALNGQIDLILVKSISRFGRNSLETQEYVHKLKEKNVEIRFEREDISSFDPQAEMIFNFLSTLAQNESKSISENVRWSYAKKAEQGVRHIGSNHVLGYDEIDGVLTPNKDAWIIETVFTSFVRGISVDQILKDLTKAGAIRMRSGTPFNRNAIYRILGNEIYVGDRLLQKDHPQNYITKKPDKDIPYKSYYLTDDHEGIVSREIWDAAKERMEKERKARRHGICRNSRSHFLYGRIFCGGCGSVYTRITINYKGEMQKCWKCTERAKGKNGNGCQNPVISEKELLESTLEVGGIQLEREPQEVDFDWVKSIRIYQNGVSAQ